MKSLIVLAGFLCTFMAWYVTETAPHEFDFEGFPDTPRQWRMSFLVVTMSWYGVFLVYRGPRYFK